MSKRNISGPELRVFPKNIENIELKNNNYGVKKTLYTSKSEVERNYNLAPQFGNCIYDYGVYLLEHGDLIKAGLVLSGVNGAENFDTMWSYALIQKARIAAILEEFDYLIAFLKLAFKNAAAFPGASGGQEELKEEALYYQEIKTYGEFPRFKEVMEHDYDNPEDIDTAYLQDWWDSIENKGSRK